MSQVRTNPPTPLFFTFYDPIDIDVDISSEKLDVWSTDLTHPVNILPYSIAGLHTYIIMDVFS